MQLQMHQVSIQGIDKRVCRMYYVQVRDVFDMKHIMSICVHVFGCACFNMSKIWKIKHARLKHMTRLTRRVKCVRIIRV
jgi:hypothetical protein